MKSYGELGKVMVFKFVYHYCLPPQMLWSVIDSYGEPWVEKFILHLNMTRQELQRATESFGSYGEQWFDILITFLLYHSRAMESYEELRRAMG